MARKMKDSGIEWIGEIPEDWKILSLKHLCNMQAGKNLNSEQISIDGEFPVYGGNGLRGYYHTFNCEGLKILVGRQGALCGNVHKVDGKYWATEHAIITEHTDLCDANFLSYLLIGMNLNQYVTSTAAQPGLAVSTIQNIKTCIPKTDEQIRIASFLDNKCARIDSILNKTRTSIEEYKKLKQSIINQAVTKGIRPNRKMKDSGIEWIGEIPKEWDSMNPKALFTQRKDRAKNGERQLTASQQFGVIYQDEYMERTGTKVVTVEKDFDILKHVEMGDFVISMRSFQGGLEYSEYTGSISSAYVMLIPNVELVFPHYYKWLLKSSVYINALQSTSNMVRDGQAMRYSNFAQVRLFMVPLEEQKEIANYLDVKISKINTLISKKEQLLTELENYKKSLIFEYVTGKKEVSVA